MGFTKIIKILISDYLILIIIILLTDFFFP